MEVTVKTADGNKPGNTSGVETPKAKVDAHAPRRVAVVDLDGPVGQFLADALCYIAPGAFNPGNWKGKLSTFVTAKTASFICCGRVVGLAYVETNPMSGENVAKGLFLLAAEGAEEQDAIELLREQKRWARDLGAGFVLPEKEYSSLSMSKMGVAVGAEKREVLFVPPLAPKK